MTRGPANLDNNRELLRLVLDEWRAVEQPLSSPGIALIVVERMDLPVDAARRFRCQRARAVLAGDNDARNVTASFTELEWE